MAATGIGFAGIDGAWWLPAVEPFRLPASCASQVAAIGPALFCFLDVVTGLYGTAEGAAGGLTSLLDYKVPTHIPRLMSAGRVESLRPDFQLVLEADAASEQQYRLVATELEICPSTHGFAHAMQVGYGLDPDLVRAFAAYLAGRPLLFVGTHHWSEFLLEQLAFCRALEAIGAQGRVLYDRPLRQLATEVYERRRWQPPMFGIQQKTLDWHESLTDRPSWSDLAPFVYTPDDQWPARVGDAVVFRFGYFDCFAPEHLTYFSGWQAQGATLLNPAQFILDSKVVMAALQLPLVRQRIANQNTAALPILDRCLPETILLTPETLPRILADKDAWVVKFAGYDSGQQAWGGRSLQIGGQHTTASWQATLHAYGQLPWPVVAQRLMPSAQVDIAYLDSQDQPQWLHNGHTRLRIFFLRAASQATAAGAHVTVSGGTRQVSEATNAVQAPVFFATTGN
ncbi:MAG: hypothetical protein DYG89_40655 [Caldilinea sp. CFX5]|nr:hypothetical protein [Caldilinea sp. CFX5]